MIRVRLVGGHVVDKGVKAGLDQRVDAFASEFGFELRRVFTGQQTIWFHPVGFRNGTDWSDHVIGIRHKYFPGYSYAIQLTQDIHRRTGSSRWQWKSIPSSAS